MNNLVKFLICAKQLYKDWQAKRDEHLVASMKRGLKRLLLHVVICSVVDVMICAIYYLMALGTAPVFDFASKVALYTLIFYGGVFTIYIAVDKLFEL
jgi:hypothetical protein